MGTNYYLDAPPACAHCGHREPERHIGKSSGGWCFSLCVYPDEGINTLADWRKLFKKHGIRNEYGEAVSAEEMIDTITARQWPRESWSDLGHGAYMDEAHFHRSNHSQRGPRGLLRHALDGVRCVGHGRGTYDYIVGEFS